MKNRNVKVKELGFYKKRNKAGEVIDVWTYTVQGTPEDVKAYTDAVEAQGREVVIDEVSKRPIHFDTICRGKGCELTISSTGKIYVNDNGIAEMQSKLRQVTDPTLKKSVADLIAQQIMGNMFSAPAPAGETTVAQVVAEEEANLDD